MANGRKIYDSKRWDTLRKKALVRDNYMCRECARYGRKTAATQVHHIKHVEDCPEKQFELENLMSLCDACHNKMHPEKGRRFKKNESKPPRVCDNCRAKP